MVLKAYHILQFKKWQITACLTWLLTACSKWLFLSVCKPLVLPLVYCCTYILAQHDIVFHKNAQHWVMAANQKERVNLYEIWCATPYSNYLTAFTLCASLWYAAATLQVPVVGLMTRSDLVPGAPEVSRLPPYKCGCHLHL
jgi:hypothetical protein